MPAPNTRIASLALVALVLTAAAPEQSSTAPPTPQRPKLGALPPAVIDNKLEIGGADIAARRANTRMTVAVQVEGRGPYRFVVDSGADTSVVGSRLAAALRLPAGTPVLLHGMTASEEVQRVRVGALALGQSTLYDLHLPVLKEEDLGGQGMLGIDALVSQRLMMDFDRKVITIEDARRPQPRLDGEIVVTARRRRGQLILTQAAVDTRPVEAVIDTGSEVSIGNSALRDRLTKRYGNKVEQVEMIGVTGRTVKIDLIRVSELRLGPVLLRDIPVAFADVPPFGVFGLDKQPALLLGTDMMANFRRVSLDFKARKVRFQLRRCDDSGILITTSAFARSSRLTWKDPNGESCKR